MALEPWKFAARLEELHDILKSADIAMEQLWRAASPEQRAQVDALTPFGHHDPMTFAKAAKTLGDKVQAEYEAGELAAEAARQVAA